MIRPSNAEIKEALLIAYDNIYADKTEFICLALPNGDAGEYIRQFIMKAIQPENTLGGWVWENILSGADADYPSNKDMKSYRLRWIDYMMEGL